MRVTCPLLSGVHSLKELSYFWVSNDRILSEQNGVFRVNCIDGLDRTNVVEVRVIFASFWNSNRADPENSRLLRAMC